MPKIAYILLCHKQPEAIIQQAEQLTAVGDYIAIHFDASSSEADYKKIKTALADNPNVTFARKRVACGWGEWSLVDATLQAVRAAYEDFPRASHFYMLSGDCMVIKTAEYIHQFLDENRCDFIESFDFFESDWIKTGLKEDRLIYRHFFNERNNKALFYGSLNLQRKLKLTRDIPADLQMMIGSQWWCLRRETIHKILKFVKQRPDVVKFFKTTWIPDETFFQTLVRHLVPRDEINNRTLTFLIFSDYGMPVNFYDDHYNLLVNQDFLFARKISPEAKELNKRLGILYASKGIDFEISNEGRNLFKFLTGKGRNGLRFAPRFWEAESSLGPDRELMIVVCKKWHVAKRLVEQIRNHTDIPAFDYIFDEVDAGMPHLGGIEATLEKRTRHRRALVRMLFDYHETNRMVICMDPNNMDLLQDFFSDRAITRLLEISCQFSDDYLIGHAKRVGLAGEKTNQSTLNRLLPTIRNEINFEADRIMDAGFARYGCIRETSDPEINAERISAFLSVSHDAALELAKTPHLFAD